METKIYILQNLGCANCAAKMEAKINALPQVQAAALTQALTQVQVMAPEVRTTTSRTRALRGS